MSEDDFPVAGKARKLTLPSFALTEVCEATDEGAARISLPVGLNETAYYERPKLTDSGLRVDGKPKWKSSRFNLFPIVLCATGLPWVEATIYILFKLENAIEPSMSTFSGIADDLAAYRRFLDDEVIEWRNFPAQKLNRPTYRYSSHLRTAVCNGVIALSSAKRRMGTVVAFYNWMKSEGILDPAYAPWKESDVYIKFTGGLGFEFTKQLITTDVSIRVPKQSDPYDGRIDDGGKLRPLSLSEQRQLVEALFVRGNTEMTLIHLLALLTGARIQTVLTFRVRHVRGLSAEQLNGDPSSEIRCPIGPGTGIDTKMNKRMSLHIPLWFFRMLLTYVNSDRAQRRRSLAVGGDTNEQYLFLSKYGAPLYSSKDDMRVFDETSDRRHPIKGQSVRKFICDAVIPYVRTKYNPTFRYQFHDLRASFGMNLTDRQLKLVEQKKRTLSQVREFVKVRMGHSSAATTDLYLQFRGNLNHIQHVTDDHDDHLWNLAAEAGLL
ncbi:MAG TPA: site-specific integrase [Noviherbaspirillum sp.]|uniref:site-specific integrase n=1 Tax=Noviherbaspirillum sp. TaxID=1926288 RepID=UPI002B49700E|nr:site-specific integrase [Noviherbaspirillum sp.]HJV88281.1 site-specific integrase [Noviherbaspirillum sp.]